MHVILNRAYDDYRRLTLNKLNLHGSAPDTTEFCFVLSIALHCNQ